MNVLSIENLDEWLNLRKQLWPKDSKETALSDIKRILQSKDNDCIGHFEGDKLVGLVEMSLRNIVDGCHSSPVAYVEAWVVDASCRGKGVGKQLIEKAKEWARNKGCTEMGSDTEVDRENSIKAHRALGFTEVDRVVNFKMEL